MIHLNHGESYLSHPRGWIFLWITLKIQDKASDVHPEDFSSVSRLLENVLCYTWHTCLTPFSCFITNTCVYISLPLIRPFKVYEPVSSRNGLTCVWILDSQYTIATGVQYFFIKYASWEVEHNFIAGLAIQRNFRLGQALRVATEQTWSGVRLSSWIKWKHRCSFLKLFQNFVPKRCELSLWLMDTSGLSCSQDCLNDVGKTRLK